MLLFISMKKDKRMIKPFNRIYMTWMFSAVLVTAGICRWMDRLGPAASQAGVKHLSVFITVFLLVYRFFLNMDPEYAEAVYPGEKVNLWNELLLYPCNVTAFAGLAGVYLNNRLLLSFVFFNAVSPLIGLLTPARGFDQYSIQTPRVICYYFYHTMITVFPVFLIKSGAYIPQYADGIYACLLFAGFSLILLPVNYLLVYTGLNPKANYFFCRVPEKNPVMEYLYSRIPYPFLFMLPLIAAFGVVNCAVVFLLKLILPL